MKSNASRLEKLEAAAGIGKAYPYMLVIDRLLNWDSAAEIARGYKIQPYIQSAGGTGAEPFYLATARDVQEFRARADVELQIYVIGELTAEESAVLGEGTRTLVRAASETDIQVTG